MNRKIIINIDGKNSNLYWSKNSISVCERIHRFKISFVNVDKKSPYTFLFIINTKIFLLFPSDYIYSNI